jgi:transcriptional regulator with XRE-family HTH domain
MSSDQDGPSPPLDSEHLRYVLGLKLRSLRQEKGKPLNAIAARSGLSVSYLSEIEKGKKYPKPGKLIELAGALDVSFDSLVSLQVDEELNPVKAVFSSSLLREFPFDLFGIQPEDLFDLVTKDPAKAGALRSSEVGRPTTCMPSISLAARCALPAHAREPLRPGRGGGLYRRARGWSGRKPGLRACAIASARPAVVDEKMLPACARASRAPLGVHHGVPEAPDQRTPDALPEGFLPLEIGHEGSPD